jgi:Holliday junction DNA helicase RuvA
MIAWLQGEILEKKSPHLVLAANGVGYWVETSMQTFYQLPEEGQTATLYIHTTIREDAHLLYGFYDKAEREMFQLLIKVNGIGPKVALGILSGIDYNELVQCILMKNTASLNKLPGVGKKTAERLIIEMQDKIQNLSYVNPANGGDGDSSAGSAAAKRAALLPFPQNLPSVQDATSALVSLGYKLPQIALAMESLDIEEKTSEQLIRDVLRFFARGN